MTQIIGLAEAAVYVKDLARAAVFYADVLGLPQGTKFIYFRDPDGNSVELIDEAHYPLIWQRLGRE